MVLARAPKDTTVYLAVGPFSPAIGGPYQTVRAYRRLLEAEGQSVHILAMAPKPKNPDPPDEGRYSDLGAGLPAILRLVLLAYKLRRSNIVVYGVWHPVFFLLGTASLLRRSQTAGRRVLVPTQSLSEWDWAKRARLKRILRPFVRAILGSFDLVVFATLGERATSVPSIPHLSAMLFTTRFPV